MVASSMTNISRYLRRPWLVLLVAITGAVAVGAAVGATRAPPSFVRRATVGDLEVIHSRVLVGTIAQSGTSRSAVGDSISTEAAGRAQLHLAEGITALIDGNTQVLLGAGRLELKHGRLFVDSPEGRTIHVVAGSLDAPVSASKVAFERTLDGAQTKVFCAQGEVMLSSGGSSTRVPSGETLTSTAGKNSLAPEKAFDDWTGGLAVPWAAKPLRRSAMAEAWVATTDGNPLSALHVTSQRVAVTLSGEFATTRQQTRYYNGMEGPVVPHVRLALPPEAILTKVSYHLANEAQSFAGAVAICSQELSNAPAGPRIEWAGNGWITGELPEVAAGGSVDFYLEYAEWLTTQNGRASLRYPILQSDDAANIGELSVQIDATNSGADFVEANQGAAVEGKRLTWRAADLRPTDDWVVSYTPGIVKRNIARAYVETATDGEDPYVLLRAETEPRRTGGVSMAIVVDTSRSVGFAGLELARQVVDALLGNLSDSDGVIVFGADEGQRAIGPATLAPSNSATRERILSELSRVRPGGASHLAKALERAADALDEKASSARNRMVVYLGDGRPSLGELTADGIRSQLQRRALGIPRIAGIALGPSADRWLLARLVAGSGPVHTVLDRSEAAQVAAKVVAAAEVTTHRDVKFELGTNIDRIYPRDGRAVASGTTAMVVGRLRGALPQSVKLSYRDDDGIKTTTLRLERLGAPSEGEIKRRWALARIQEIVAASEGIEPALLLARQHGLLLPWTEWVLSANQSSNKVTCSPFSSRIVELSTLNDTPYARRIDEAAPPGGGWLEPPSKFDPGQSLEQGATLSGQAKIANARASMLTCRNARIHIVPNLPELLEYRVALGATGNIERVAVTGNGGGRNDAVYFSCIERVIRNLSLVGAERPISISGIVRLPPLQDPKRTQCSPVAQMPLLLRRNVWATRSGDALLRYETAIHGCETATWTERRELLESLIGQYHSAVPLLELADKLTDRGHLDAADFVRGEAIRRVTSLGELVELRAQILRNEPNLDADIAAKVKAVTGDRQKLSVVIRALAMAPHSPLGRRLQLLLLERLSDESALQGAIETLRSDPFTDAGLIALAAAAVRRLGRVEEGQRIFSELFERAPRDPWILAFAGDQLRTEGFPQQALAAYENLERVTPNDTATLLRGGLAQANAGRVDIATRLLERAAQTAGRSEDQRLNEFGAVLRAMVLGRAQLASVDAAEKAELGRRLAQTALPDVAAILLVETPARPELDLTIRAFRGDDKTPQAPDLDASLLGLSALFVDRGASTITVEVSRRLLAGLGAAMPVTVSVMVLGESPTERQLRTVTAAIPSDQDHTSITLTRELRP